MPSRRQLAALTAASLTLLVPSTAIAASGGAAVPSSNDVRAGTGDSGGTSVGTAAPQAPKAPTKTKPRRSSLELTSFALNGARFYEYGRSIRVTFKLTGASGATGELKLVVARGGSRVKVVDLGRRAANTSHSYTLPTAGLPSGSLELRISGRDSRGRAIRQGPSAASARSITVHSHRFPVVGPHTFGGEGSRFGADRDHGKRKHQGQDVSAAEGTPMVAARGGVVRFTGNQPSGAGVYLVIQGAGESRDYVYMHLVAGSLLVKQGQTVRTGQLIGKVGQTGVGTGPHLHFEIWQGAWQQGGKPIDPLEHLQRWDSWS